MTKASTQLDLVRMVYHELPTLARLELEHSLSVDAEARAEYVRLRTAARELPRARFSPPPSLMSNILAYSRKAS